MDATGNVRPAGAIASLAAHWPEYLIESAALGLFMLSACACVTLIEHPDSPVASAVADPWARRALIGLAMGLTAIAIVYSPWGKQSGAHLNPVVTLTFRRLGRIARWDTAFYVVAQFAGAAAGMALARAAIGATWLAHPAVAYVVTRPGDRGPWVALLAEAAISFGMMLTVLSISNRPRINRYTGLAAGALIAVYILVEAPLSGTSMNPARTTGSALVAGEWTAIWLYFVGPLAGMLAAAELYLRTSGSDAVLCCKLHHDNDRRCIFHCRYREAAMRPPADAARNVLAQGAPHG